MKREVEDQKLEVENDELRQSITIQRQNIQSAVRQYEELEVKIRDLEEELERDQNKKHWKTFFNILHRSFMREICVLKKWMKNLNTNKNSKI